MADPRIAGQRGAALPPGMMYDLRYGFASALPVSRRAVRSRFAWIDQSCLRIALPEDLRIGAFGCGLVRGEEKTS